MSWSFDAKAYQEAGFCVLRGVVGSDALVTMRADFDQMMRLARERPEGGEIAGATFVTRAEPFQLKRVVWAGPVAPSLEALSQRSDVLATAREALGTEDIVQLIQQAHFKEPGDEVSFSLHQDASNRRYGSSLWTDVLGNGSFVQMVIALDDADESNGGLVVYPGSHREGFVSDPETGAVPEAVIARYRPLVPRLQAGDAVVFGPFLVHGSPANRGERMRRVAIVGYAADGANSRVYPGCGVGVSR